MPPFSQPITRELLQLQWGGDEGQTSSSWRTWRRMILLHASNSRGGQLLSGLTDEDAPVSQAAAAATFLGIVCNAGRMQAIVEESQIPNDGYQMFKDITEYYDTHFRPQELQEATAFFNVPAHSGMSLDDYYVRLTRSMKILNPTGAYNSTYSDVQLLHNMLTTSGDNVVRTPAEITPRMRSAWYQKLAEAHRQRLVTPNPDDTAPHPAYAGITLSAFFAYVHAERLLNPATTSATTPVMATHHQKRNQPPCHYILHQQPCPYAERCRFSHEVTPDVSHRTAVRPNSHRHLPPRRVPKAFSAFRQQRGPRPGRTLHPAHRQRRHIDNRHRQRPRTANAAREVCRNHQRGRCPGGCGRIHETTADALHRYRRLAVQRLNDATDVARNTNGYPFNALPDINSLNITTPQPPRPNDQHRQPAEEILRDVLRESFIQD